jgi:hypothetical protein
MRQRLSGESKKGRNLAYGLRYARVIGETYRRERRASKAMPPQFGQPAADPANAEKASVSQSQPS